MAQNKDGTAELKLKSTLCVNNCGLPGNPTTKNMCQSCYKASIAINDSVTSCSGQDKPRPCPASEQPQLVEREEGKAVVLVVGEEGKKGKVDELRVRAVNRCAGCMRKVGLTGFRCRCGDLFCAEHRYSDRHACRFDYKAAGREQIARENPVFKAPKILRF